jgi:hypothetical protein
MRVAHEALDGQEGVDRGRLIGAGKIAEPASIQQPDQAASIDDVQGTEQIPRLILGKHHRAQKPDEVEARARR